MARVHTANRNRRHDHKVCALAKGGVRVQKAFRRKLDRFDLRQGALTLGEMVCGSVLEPCEGLVRLKTLGKVLCALCTNAVPVQTANGSQNQTSGGADGRETMRGSVLEGCEGLVLLQAL